MRENDLKLIPYCFGLGAKNHGCADGPTALFKYQLQEKLAEKNIATTWEEFNNYEEAKISSPLAALPYVFHECMSLKHKVTQTISSNDFPITIGGDHTMAIGTWNGVAEGLMMNHRLGLIWIDAHMDSHTPGSSHSGAYHGMPLATLMGHGAENLAQINTNQGCLKPEHICLIGIRSYEQEELEFLKKLNVKIFYMNDVNELGLKSVIDKSIEHITNNGAINFGVSVDLDAIDPEEAPGVGSPEASGIKKDELINAIKVFGKQENFKALEIAEYNPHLDIDNKTAVIVQQIIESIFS